MSKMLRIGWLGGGKMAQALAKGIVSTGLFGPSLLYKKKLTSHNPIYSFSSLFSIVTFY
jgi:pyrroline-5-carboxylate reductase